MSPHVKSWREPPMLNCRFGYSYCSVVEGPLSSNACQLRPWLVHGRANYIGGGCPESQWCMQTARSGQVGRAPHTPRDAPACTPTENGLGRSKQRPKLKPRSRGLPALQLSVLAEADCMWMETWSFILMFIPISNFFYSVIHILRWII